MPAFQSPCQGWPLEFGAKIKARIKCPGQLWQLEWNHPFVPQILIYFHSQTPGCQTLDFLKVVFRGQRQQFAKPMKEIFLFYHCFSMHLPCHYCGGTSLGVLSWEESFFFHEGSVSILSPLIYWTVCPFHYYLQEFFIVIVRKNYFYYLQEFSLCLTLLLYNHMWYLLLCIKL